MTLATTPRIPDQAVLEGLMADAQGVADAIAELLGAAGAYVTIGIQDVPSDPYHALPHPTRTSSTYAWKSVARGPSISRIDVDCVDKAACPERVALAVAAEIAAQGIDPVYEAFMADQPKVNW